jgi:hypothetical protein
MAAGPQGGQQGGYGAPGGAYGAPNGAYGAAPAHSGVYGGGNVGATGVMRPYGAPPAAAAGNAYGGVQGHYALECCCEEEMLLNK